MVKITYRENTEKGLLSLYAEGHAGYAEKGRDIVCAAVSTLMQTLAYSVDNDGCGGAIHFDGGKDGPVFSVEARMNPANRAKFELVLNGLYLLEQTAPEYVAVINLCADAADRMDLQMFALSVSCAASSPKGGANASAGADGFDLQLFADGAGGDGGAAAGTDAGGEGQQAAAIEMPKLRPAEERLARRSGVLKRTSQSKPDGFASSPKGGANASTGAAAADRDETGKAEGSAGEGSGSEGSENGEGEQKERTPEERKKAFTALMQGEYRAEAEAMMQQAVQLAAQNLQASPAMQGLLAALQEKYGTDADSLEALTEAVKNGAVKDDAYYENLAMEKGVSVKTARELDQLESQNRRLTAQQQAAQEMAKQQERQQQAAQMRAYLEQQETALKQRYPDFGQYRDEFLANPETKKMLLGGVSMETAYRAMYFDRLMEADRAATARQVEQGVVNRVQQRNARPGENGTRPGGAVQTKVDVAHMSRREMEELEKRARRGEIITL